jgi:hypothetical protein
MYDNTVADPDSAFVVSTARIRIVSLDPDPGKQIRTLLLPYLSATLNTMNTGSLQ